MDTPEKTNQIVTPLSKFEVISCLLFLWCLNLVLFCGFLFWGRIIVLCVFLLLCFVVANSRKSAFFVCELLNFSELWSRSSGLSSGFSFLCSHFFCFMACGSVGGVVCRLWLCFLISTKIPYYTSRKVHQQDSSIEVKNLCIHPESKHC